MIHLGAPEWLALVPLLIFAGWRWRSWRLHEPLRAGCLVLLFLVLVDPEVRRLARGLDLWVLVDRSASANTTIGPKRAEWERLLEKSRQSGDRLLYVDYGGAPTLRVDGAISEVANDATRTNLAAQFALAKMDPKRASRLLVLSDGFSTEALTGLGEKLARQHVPLDFRLAGSDNEDDFRAGRLVLPTRVQMAEPFLIEFQILGSRDATVPWQVWRDSELIGSGKADVREGHAVLRFIDQVKTPGAHHYRARIEPTLDTFPGNNTAETWLEVVGGPRLLLVTSYNPDPLAEVWRAQGFTVETVTDTLNLHPGSLAGVRGVILNNVAASRLAPEFLGALEFFVKEQGGGLLMAGGSQSFGAGGYFQSAVDRLLPVSMELRQDQRKLAVAMVIAMDRSGSMAAGVDGRPGLTKMDLADEGAARAVELLSPQDAIAVFAVDTAAHAMVPMTTVGGNQPAISGAIRKIASQGGGIYIGAALQAAYDEIRKAQAGQRHIILFADAGDSEEAGDYKPLIAQMEKDGITLSVIGLGSRSDKDAALLEDIALLGKGRMFFNANPDELPGLFAQETVAVARSAFLKEPVGLEAGAGWLEMAARPLPWLAAVDGYNLSYLRPEATGGAFSKDEYRAPLIAFWQRGAGRAAAVSFPLGGDFSKQVRAWPAYGDFAQTLGRWLMGEDTPPGIGFRTRLEADALQLDLYYEGKLWEEKLALEPPRIALAQGTAVTAPVWERMQPGHYRATVQLKESQPVRGVIQVGKHTLPFGPLTLGNDAEWAFNRDRISELRAVSRVSGGVERLDLTQIWGAPRPPQFASLRVWSLAALALLFVIECLVTRLGIRLAR